MFKIVLIALGGGVGAVLRFAVSGWAQRLSNGSFPTGTLLVNVVGCSMIGLLGALFAGPHLVREEYRFAILVGLLGAFTTFSTFGWETFALLNDGQWRQATVNVLASNFAGLLAVWFGYRLGTKWFGA